MEFLKVVQRRTLIDPRGAMTVRDADHETLRARLAAAESERDSALVNLQWRNELVGQMRQQQQTLLEHVHVLKHKYDIAKVSSSLQGGAAARTCSPVSRYVPVCAGGESNAPVAGLAE